MSDHFLSRLRDEPRTEFTRSLRQRLRTIETEEAEPTAHRGRRRGLALAWTATASMVFFAFMLPPVRAAARGFLDLFRVKRFAAVPVDPERLTRLQQGGLDLKALVSEQVEVIEPARAPEVMDGPEAAGEAAGIVVRRPATIPRGAAFAEIAVGHPGAFRVSLDVSKIELVAKTVGVEDVEIPAEWNGATLEVQAPPVVVLRYRRGSDDFVVLQSKSPELSLPPGVDLSRLGAVGLRMAGMSPEEARLFARSIDWRSTVLVPIPIQGGTFREVEIHGHKGLLVTSNHPPRSVAEGGTRSGSRWHSVLLWAEGNEVFALHGPGQGVEVLEMAQSIG